MEKVHNRKVSLKNGSIRIFFLILTLCSLFVLAGCISETKEVDKSAAKGTDKPVNSTDKSSSTLPTPKVPEYFIKVTGNRPWAIAFDKRGAMYMVTAPSRGSGALSKVSTDGIVQELATLDGSFIGPGIDVDKDGNAYITVGDKLLKATPEGKVTVISEGFSRCIDVKLDSKGNLFVADDLEDTIYKITPSGEKSVFYKDEKRGRYVLTSLVMDKNYKYLYAYEVDTIIKFDMRKSANNRKPEVVVNKPGVFYICMDTEDNIFASVPYENTVIRVNSDGNIGDVGNLQIPMPVGIASGGKGFDEKCLYVAAMDGIVKISK